MINSECMKVVVIGSGGRLGRSLVGLLGRFYQVIGLDRNQLDLASEKSIEMSLGDIDYNYLFLAGALTGVDYCETHEEEAYTVNSTAPGKIAEISASKGAHVTYISTDMVFDGRKSGLYSETDIARPVSVYGASKLLGELQVMNASSLNLVARVSWVFGPGRPAFPEWIIGQACAMSDLTLPGNKLGCPGYVLDLIEWLHALVFLQATGPASGIIHLCNAGPCSWRDWGQFCIDTALQAGFPVKARNIRGIPLDSVTAFVAERPVNSAMSTEFFTKMTGIKPREWREALREHLMSNYKVSV